MIAKVQFDVALGDGGKTPDLCIYNASIVRDAYLDNQIESFQ